MGKMRSYRSSYRPWKFKGWEQNAPEDMGK
jgi:hypothetical protein